MKAWTDVFDASVEGPACPQPDMPNISEDCLRLNVYTNEVISISSITHILSEIIKKLIAQNILKTVL